MICRACETGVVVPTCNTCNEQWIGPADALALDTHAYYDRYVIEGDAYAFVCSKSNQHIGVQFVEGDSNQLPHKLTVREARVLAASLLRAAALAEGES